MIKRVGAFLLAIAIGIAGPAQAAPWTRDQAGQLFNWLERAPEEAIDLPEGTVAAFRSALGGDDQERLDETAQNAALKLLQAWHGRCCGAKRPQWWHIDAGADDDELRAGLEAALQNDSLGAYLLSSRPNHPHYDALAEQYGRETRTDRREIIAANLARWRWMPGELGPRYLLVNIASQNLTLWDRGRVTGRWRVIIGKPATKNACFHDSCDRGGDQSLVGNPIEHCRRRDRQLRQAQSRCRSRSRLCLSERPLQTDARRQ